MVVLKRAHRMYFRQPF